MDETDVHAGRLLSLLRDGGQGYQDGQLARLPSVHGLEEGTPRLRSRIRERYEV